MMKEEHKLNIPVLSESIAQGAYPEYLLWIGCAGSYDERYKKVIRSFIRILNLAKVDFAVLGPEESCTGDPARRAGNKFLFPLLEEMIGWSIIRSCSRNSLKRGK